MIAPRRLGGWMGVGLLVMLAACRGREQPAVPPAANDPWAAKAPTATHAVTSVPAAPDAPPEPAVSKPFFYTATKGAQTVYLLGTMHMGVSLAALPKPVMDAFAQTKQLVVEADINDPSLLFEVMRKDGKTLRDDVGDEGFAKFEAIVGKREAAGASKLRPSMAASLLQMQGLPPTGYMDLKLMTAAKDAGAKVIFLETAQSQLKLLEKWITGKMLLAMIDHIDEMKKSNSELLALYRAGDDAALVALSNDQAQAELMGITPAQQAALMEELLFARNAAWIDGIEAAAAGGPTFVAVGALHLLGPRSVNELLAARGWTIARAP